MEQQLTFNLVGKVRRVTENGRKYLVAPLSLIVPGVLAGSDGPIFYPPDEVEKSVGIWNNVPLLLNHPLDEQGNRLTSKSPGVLEKSLLGVIRNARFHRGKAVGEGWFDVEHCHKVDKRVHDALVAGQPIELSTGLFVRNRQAAEEGANYNGKPYSEIGRDYYADHLAILPDQIGACSLNDGCGVLVNQADPEKLGILKKLAVLLGLAEAVPVQNAWTDAARAAAAASHRAHAATTKIKGSGAKRNSRSARDMADMDVAGANSAYHHDAAAKLHEHEMGTATDQHTKDLHAKAIDLHKKASELHRKNITTNAWSDAARVAAAASRKAHSQSQTAGHPASEANVNRMSSQTALEASESGEHEMAARWHKSAAKAHGASDGEAHSQAAALHLEAATAHTKAGKAKYDAARKATGNAWSDEAREASAAARAAHATYAKSRADAHAATAHAWDMSSSQTGEHVRHADRAMDESHKNDHEYAGDAHRRAAESHQEQADASDEKGHSNDKKFHEGAVAAHKKAAGLHDKAVDHYNEAVAHPTYNVLEQEFVQNAKDALGHGSDAKGIGMAMHSASGVGGTHTGSEVSPHGAITHKFDHPNPTAAVKKLGSHLIKSGKGLVVGSVAGHSGGIQFTPNENGPTHHFEFTNRAGKATAPGARARVVVANDANFRVEEEQEEESTITTEGELMTKLTEQRKKEVVDQIVANCSCSENNVWGEGDRTVLNAMTDEKLLKILNQKQSLAGSALVVNSVRQGLKVGEDVEIEDIVTNLNKKLGVKPAKKDDEDEDTPVANSREEWLAAQPDFVQEIFLESEALVNNEKKQIITSLTKHITDKAQRKLVINQLASKPMPELRLLKSLIPTNNARQRHPLTGYNDATGYRLPNYMAAAGAVPVANAGDFDDDDDAQGGSGPSGEIFKDSENLEMVANATIDYSEFAYKKGQVEPKRQVS